MSTPSTAEIEEMERDLAVLRRAMRKGEQSVQYQDKRVVYKSTADMQAAIRLTENSLAAARSRKPMHQSRIRTRTGWHS